MSSNVHRFMGGMTDYDIRFLDVDGEPMDMRPPGASELLEALYDCARSGKPINEHQAADAHNYICALESKVSAYYHEAKTLREQSEEHMQRLFLKSKAARQSKEVSA